ncbi:MAG: DUF2116 family Zn-ribbon domain-containing protein [Terriglobia bacterium]
MPAPPVRWSGCRTCRASRTPPNHRHCVVCGIDIPENGRRFYCSPGCRLYEKKRRRRANSIEGYFQPKGSQKRLRVWLPRRLLH